MTLDGSKLPKHVSQIKTRPPSQINITRTEYTEGQLRLETPRLEAWSREWLQDPNPHLSRLIGLSKLRKMQAAQSWMRPEIPLLCAM